MHESCVSIEGSPKALSAKLRAPGKAGFAIPTIPTMPTIPTVPLTCRRQPNKLRLDSRAIKRGAGTSKVGLVLTSNCNIAEAARRPNS